MNDEQGATIVVTGGCGFIGSHLVDKLSDIGFDVVVVDDLRQGEYIWDRPNIQYFFEDVSYCKLIEKITRPVGIIHLANSPRVRRSLEEPRDTINNNINTTTAVCDWARHWQTFLFFATSSSTQYSESVNPYTWSKAACDSILDMYEELYDLKFMKMFFYNVYGPREADYGPYSTVIRKFKKDYLTGKPLTIFGNGSKERDFTHVDDVVQGMLQLLVDPRHLKEVHLGKGDPKTILSIAQAFNTTIVHGFDKPGEAQSTLCKTPYIECPNDVFSYIDSWLKENTIDH
jgi:UDP-glucose 4-epimerase